MRDSLQHSANGSLAYFPAGLVEGGKGDTQQSGILHVVDGDDS
jgi:hypothetical protein